MNLIYDFSSQRDAKTYMALVDSILAPFVLIFMILIGWLISNGNYELSLNILITSLFIGIFIMLFIVEDPKNEKII